jgi:hypothetical protein
MPSTHADPITNAYACARRQDDVISVRDAERLGLTKWDIRVLRRTDELRMRGVLTIPPVRDALRSQARAIALLIPDAVIATRADCAFVGWPGWTTGNRRSCCT